MIEKVSSWQQVPFKNDKEDYRVKNLSDKVSYLQGLSEGLNVADSSPQGKIVSGVLKVLEDMTRKMHQIESDLNNLQEYVEDMDLEFMEWEKKIGQSGIMERDDIVELSCSNCGEQLYFETDMLDEDVLEIVCPNCNTVVYVNDSFFDYDTSYDDEDFSFRHRGEQEQEEENPSPS